MKQNKKIIVTIALVIAIAFTSLLYFGIGENEKTPIQIAAFLFILMDELIAYGVILGVYSKKSNTFLTAGIISLTVIYLLISLAVNILLKYVFTALKGFLIFNFSMLLLYLFIATIILFFKKENQ